MSRTGAKALIETLTRHNVDRFFCVPGESYLAVLDELVGDSTIRVITCRHEGGAGFMAAADAKVSGRPGILFVSRGPGATNASIALHSANTGSVPLVAFVGQVSTSKLGRGALQEMDFTKTFGDTAKRIEQINHPDRIPEIVARAFHVAQSGTPGPVVVALPTDILMASTKAPAVAPRAVPHITASDTDIGLVAEALAAAERPILVPGRLCGSPEGRGALRAAAERWSVPVMPTFQHPDVFSNDHPLFGGELGIRPPAGVTHSIMTADLILAVGTRLPDMATQGFRIPGAGQRLIHVHPDSHQIGLNADPELGIVSAAPDFLGRLAARTGPKAGDRNSWTVEVRRNFEEGTVFQSRNPSDGVDFGHIVAAMNKHLPDDAIVAIDAGSFSSWVHQQFRFKSTQLMLGSEAGAMGMGIPAAVAAALRHPHRQTIAIVGDGGALMTGSEMATAVREGVRIRVIVSNNRNYGTIRFHQEMHYPGRVHSANNLVNPDFAAYAESFGARGLRIDTPDQADAVFQEALAHEGPVMVDVRSSLEAISSLRTITEMREA